MLENIGNAITRLGRNLGGRIQPTPLPQNRFLGIGRHFTANRTVNVRV